jgi:hypothetical protein
MADETKPEKLTLGEALKDLCFFPILFAVAVGGPSILAILEPVLVNHQFVPALQWIIDGYNRIMAVLGAAVEPLVKPAIDWVNAWLGWSLTVYPVWRPVFALCMVCVMAAVRNGIREQNLADAAGGGGLLTIGCLAAALPIGLFATGDRWWPPAGTDGASSSFAEFGVIVLGWFASGAGLSIVPGLAQSGGLIALGMGVALIGAISAWYGLVWLGMVCMLASVPTPAWALPHSAGSSLRG